MEREKINFEELFFENKYRAALMVITIDQEIFEFTCEHEKAAIKIYDSLYGLDDIDKDEYFGFWFSDKGAITIEFVDSGFIVINIPEDGEFYLNDYQYGRLEKLFESLNYINYKLTKKGKLPLEITSNLSEEELSFDEVLIILKDSVFGRKNSK